MAGVNDAHWHGREGGYSLDYLLANNAQYSDRRTHRVHMRLQVMLAAWTESRGLVARLEYALPMEDGQLVSPNDLSVDMLQLGNRHANPVVPYFVWEVSACVAYEPQAGRFHHASCPVCNSIASAARKRAAIDANLAYLNQTDGWPLFPITGAAVIVCCCDSDKVETWKLWEAYATQHNVDLYYSGHFIPWVDGAWCLGGTLV